MLTCTECNSKAGKHHIVYKGSKSIIVYMPINEIDLCKRCHREIHTNKLMDYKYKALLQTKLQKLLPDKFYSLDALKKILQLDKLRANILARHIHLDENGYDSFEIIKYLMCGKVYRLF